MRHDPTSAAVVVMLRGLKMHGMAQAVGDLIEQGAPAFGAAVPMLSQLLKAEMAEREVRSIDVYKRQGLAQTYPPVVRFAWHYVLPALALFKRNVNTPAKSGKRLAHLAAGSEGLATGKYVSDGRETLSSDASYDQAKALEMWNGSADMTDLPHDLACETSAPVSYTHLSAKNSFKRRSFLLSPSSQRR